jgi:hypothetical protein
MTSIKRTIAALSLMGLVIAIPTAVFAQSGIQGKWSLTAKGGLNIEISGDVHDGGTGTVLALPTTVVPKSFSDIYKSALDWEFSLGYGVSASGEILGIFSYRKTSAERIQVGDVAEFPLFALFDDWNETGVRLGYRQYFMMDSALKPYLTVSGGVKFLKRVNSTLTVPAAEVVLADVPFYDKSTLLTFGANVGLCYDVSPNFGILLDAGLQYQGKPKQIEGLAGTGLENINDVASRLYAPISVGAVIRF